MAKRCLTICSTCPHNPPSIVTKEQVMRGGWVPCNQTVEPNLETAKTHHVRVMMMRNETECAGVRLWRMRNR